MGVMKVERLAVYSRQFGQAVVTVYRVPGPYWSVAPWRFEITFPGKGLIQYTGVPNYCETRQKAIMRAWWRAKWLNDGTYAQRYRVFYVGTGGV